MDARHSHAVASRRLAQVTDAVHAAHGRIFAQLWHVGRLSHTSLLGGRQPVSSSPLQAKGVNVFIAGEDGSTPGFVQASEPRALTIDEIGEIVDQYRAAARHAIEAGFDGVELHGANGYLVNQFIDSNANTRTDAYGGSLENRLRFLREVTQALIDGTGDASRVGIRLAPLTTLNGCVDDDPERPISPLQSCSANSASATCTSRKPTGTTRR